MLWCRGDQVKNTVLLLLLWPITALGYYGLALSMSSLGLTMSMSCFQWIHYFFLSNIHSHFTTAALIKNDPGPNAFLSNALGALVEIPPYFLLVLLLDPWGRLQILLSKQNNDSSPIPDALSLWFAFWWRLFPVLEQPRVLKAQSVKRHLPLSVRFSPFKKLWIRYSQNIQNLCCFAGKLFAAANFALVYIVTAELFPTYIRTTAIGRSRLISFRNPFLV